MKSRWSCGEAEAKEGDGSCGIHRIVRHGAGGFQMATGTATVILPEHLRDAVNGKRSLQACRDRHAQGTPMGNMFVSMLDMLGVEPEHFGDSTGKLDRLSI